MPVLEITTMVGCPLVCTYCPQDKLNRNYPVDSKKFLSLESFSKVLKKIPPDTVINFCGYSEPFSNPDCLSLITHAASQKFTIFMHTTLQGASPEAVYELCKLYTNDTIRKFVIHLPDGHNNMRGFEMSHDYRYAIEKVVQLENIQLMTMSADGIIHSEVYDFLHSLKSKDIMNKLPDGWRAIRRAGNLKERKIDVNTLTPKVKISESITCGYTPFYDHNVLMPNGDVILCCMDYGQKHIFGNLLTDSYEDLFRSKEFLGLMEVNRSATYSDKSLCKKCEKANYQVLEGSEFVLKHPIEANGRRTTNLAKTLSKFGVPQFAHDKIVDLYRSFNRFLSGQ
jgi:radical SAM protein with 4Fe4S-binding SPASM domain